MFTLFQRSARRICKIYAVHKSGPSNDQTKFLINANGVWEWHWANDFEPVETRATARKLWRDAALAC